MLRLCQAKLIEAEKYEIIKLEFIFKKIINK